MTDETTTGNTEQEQHESTRQGERQTAEERGVGAPASAPGMAAGDRERAGEGDERPRTDGDDFTHGDEAGPYGGADSPGDREGQPDQ